MSNAQPTKPSYALTIGVCHNCHGLGKLSHFGHIEGGVCFQCGGDGFFAYLDRTVKFLDVADRPRAVRLETIRQAIAAFRFVAVGVDAEEFLMRNRKRARVMLLRTIRENASTLGPEVWDRAYAAVHVVFPLDADKVAALRAKTFPAVAA